MSFADHRVALFDLDGTLVDSVPLIIASYQHALTTVLGRPGDEAVVRSWIGRPLIDAFVEVSPERAQELFDCYSAWNLAHALTVSGGTFRGRAAHRPGRGRRARRRGDLEAPVQR